MYWVDGTIYKGEWQFGAQHGKGQLTLPNGLIKEGNFDNNQYVGNKKVEATPLAEEDAEQFPDLMEDRAEVMQKSQQSPQVVKLKNKLLNSE